MKVPKFFKNMNIPCKVAFFFGIFVILSILGKHLYDHRQYVTQTTESFLGSGREQSLVLFHVDWCHHCKAILPIWQKFEAAHNGKTKINVSNINCEQNPHIAKRFNLEGFPTILYLENGAIKETYSGDRTLDALTEFLKKIEGS